MDSVLKKRNVFRMSNKESHRITKECIRTALILLMETTPFDKITITSVITKSGVSRAAFYRNYSSKEDVMKEIIEQFSEKLYSSVCDALIKDNIEGWIEFAFERIKNNKEIYILMEKADLAYNDMFEKAISTIRGKPENKYQYYRIHAICSSMWSIALDWVKNGMQDSPREIAEYICRIFSL